MKKRKIVKRNIYPDMVYNSLEISKFINVLTLHGKKNKSKNIVYKAFNYIKDKLKKDPFLVFSVALDNIAPLIEIKKKKIKLGYNNMAFEISNSRRATLAMKWIKEISRKRAEKYMYLKLGNELIDAYNKRGKCIKKREDIHKISDSNRFYFHHNR